MPNGSTAHEVLAVVFQVREVTGQIKGGSQTEKPQLNVLLWERAREPQRGAWSLPGGRLRNDEDMTTSVRRQLAEKVDLRELAHLEQLAVFSDPHRVPGTRVIASTFLGLVPSPATPELPPDTRWHPVNSLPTMA
ncbi:NUDIX domain-containing protein, partial [Mycobacterium lacus]|uniref:NUDIX domain-containing protein n=1 Tax=Mycobacterium lacus TaxID=169765 RepID=UPI00111BD76A